MSRLRSCGLLAAGSSSLRRLLIGCSAAGLLLAGVALASSTAVQATTPPTEVSAADHPIVGAWILTVEEFGDSNLIAFHADGTYQESSADGTAGIGSWAATGPTTFNLTFVELDEEGSSAAIRAAGEVSEDEQTFTAEFTIEFIAQGGPTGEYGPGHVTGTRINVEPSGAPAGSLEDLSAQFEEGTAPAGTDGGGEVAGYCAAVAELDAQEGSPTPEQLEGLRQLAPEAIAAEINAVVDGFLAQGPAFFGSEEAAELFEPIEAFEAENCPADAG